LKPERWGSPLVQEKYQEEETCDKRHPYHIIIIIIIIIWCFLAEVSGQPIGPISKGQAMLESSWTVSTFETGPIVCSETSARPQFYAA
jgi:hypothetical protein